MSRHLAVLLAAASVLAPTEASAGTNSVRTTITAPLNPEEEENEHIIGLLLYTEPMDGCLFISSVHFT